MINRFLGSDGMPRLVAALLNQQTVQNDENLARDLAAIVSLVQIEPNCTESMFIEQGGADNDIYLILAGSVSIMVNGREKARRKSGQHVGDLAAIDPTARRSASVVAIEQTVLAKVTEPDFTRLAMKYPVVWRRLALEIAERLRQRGLEVQAPNTVPEVFVGSSVEALPVAREIQSALAHDRMIVKVWTDGVFRASRGTVESLLEAVKKADFAALVLTADDTVISREIERQAPRDNCIFELGLFMGALGRDRSFIIKPRGVDIKLPSDLLGITPLEYADGSQDNLAARVAHVCNDIRKAISSLGSK
jgi:predicted nucleotide-binding protein